MAIGSSDLDALRARDVDAFRPLGVHCTERSDALAPRAEQLLQGFEKIVLESGFAHLTMSDVAAKLKCSKSTLYQVADSRDELVLVVLDRLLRRSAKRAIDAIKPDATPRERLITFGVTAISEFADAQAQWTRDIEGFPEAQELYASWTLFAAGLFERLIEAGIESGDVRPVHPAVVVEMILGAATWFRGGSASTRLANRGISTPEAAERLFDLIDHALAPHST